MDLSRSVVVFQFLVAKYTIDYILKLSKELLCPLTAKSIVKSIAFERIGNTLIIPCYIIFPRIEPFPYLFTNAELITVHTPYV